MKFEVIVNEPETRFVNEFNIMEVTGGYFANEFSLMEEAEDCFKNEISKESTGFKQVWLLDEESKALKYWNSKTGYGLGDIYQVCDDNGRGSIYTTVAVSREEAERIFDNLIREAVGDRDTHCIWIEKVVDFDVFEDVKEYITGKEPED